MAQARQGTHLNVNRVSREVDVVPDETLLVTLREHLMLTGTKYGCGEGQCGACTVLIDGRAMRACQVTVRQVAQRQVQTIEGLAAAGLHPLQQAFLDHDALQCGYCTPGMIMASVALLTREQSPSREQINAALQGNLCRCGAYPRIVEAVESAARVLNASRTKSGER